jgi:kumamolisin
MSVTIPPGYWPLRGSDRVQPPRAKAIGRPADDEELTITVVLRRRTDLGAQPSPAVHLSSYALPREFSPEESGRRYGACDADMELVTGVLAARSMVVLEKSAPTRTIRARGRARHVADLLGVTLIRFRLHRPSRDRQAPEGHVEYISYVGPLFVPRELSEVIVGVFGLEFRALPDKNGQLRDPATTTAIPVQTVIDRYQFPQTSAAGQRIGIVSTPGADGTWGYSKGDLEIYFSGTTVPEPTVLQPDGTTWAPGTPPDGETTQDVTIAAAVAQGAEIIVFTILGNPSAMSYVESWLALLAMVHSMAVAGTPLTTLSISIPIAPGDDATGLSESLFPLAPMDLHNLCMGFEDVALDGTLTCVASGDWGPQGRTEPPESQQVQYPATDPSVLACGGTTIGLDTSGNQVEYVWNDCQVTSGDPYATGGGISARFPLPPWQTGIEQPALVGGGHANPALQPMRCVPDVAGNASLNAGYKIVLNRTWQTGGGTSAVAPLYAGLFAVISAELGERIGFINPLLYSYPGSFTTDIVPGDGPDNNSMMLTTGEVVMTGYPAGPGWDACTGWGTINGKQLRHFLTRWPLRGQLPPLK